MPEFGASLDLLRRLAVCPDDGGALVIGDDCLRCGACGTEHRVSDMGIVDMRPRQPRSTGTAEYWVRYRSMFAVPSETAAESLPWGAPETASALTLARKQLHVEAVQSCLSLASSATRPSVLCDLTGGAGHYTLAYSRFFDHVIHCDLDPASLRYTAGKARTLGLTNMLFVRIDYLQAPFVHSLDRIICLDSLIRGPEHERIALESLRRMLASGGIAVVDFHNWWHNPLRRLGLLPENFHTNMSYSVREVKNLLRSTGLPRHQWLPFRQEAAESGPLRIFSRLIPPTRLIFTIPAQ
jgi:SAM-dependent methyltransferase